MRRLVLFSTAAFLILGISIYSISDERPLFQKETVDDRISQLQKQYDNLQKYIFNSQFAKGKANVETDFNTSQFIGQVKLLRKEVEELKKEMNLLKTTVNSYNDNLDKKIIELQNEVNDREYDRKLLDMIDTGLDASSNLKNSNLKQRKEFIDATKLKEEEKKYDSIMDMIDRKNYEQAARELKSFVINNPDSIFSPSVFFYLGEIAFKQKNYTLAAINYFKGYQADRNGEKSINNLIMLSKSMIKVGKYTTACKVIRYIEDNFSNIPALMRRNINDIKISAQCNN